MIDFKLYWKRIDLIFYENTYKIFRRLAFNFSDDNKSWTVSGFPFSTAIWKGAL